MINLKFWKVTIDAEIKTNMSRGENIVACSSPCTPKPPAKNTCCEDLISII